MDDATRTLTLARSPRPGERPHLLVIQAGSSSLFPLPSAGAVVIGRAPDAAIRLLDSAASRQHASITVVDGEVHLSDLESHNGTRLNGERLVGTAPLRSGDVIAIGDTVLVFHDARPAARGHVLLDPVRLRERLEEEVERAVGYERPLALCAISLGAGAGDPGAVRRAVEPELRAIDLVGQEGAAQLVVVMPECRKEAALAAAARLLQALRPLLPEARAGIACCPEDGCRAGTLLAAARASMAQAGAGAVEDAAASVTTFDIAGRRVLVADPAMVQVFALVRRLAASDLSVLIAGETGAGKENAAWALHHWSPRAAKPLVTLNCAALPDNLIESELFGYDKGAFSGAAAAKPGLLEQAHGGTVFLDEVGELSAMAQAKLLRALEAKKVTRLGSVTERTVDLRVVAASNRVLEEEVKAGRFRQDLLYRLNAATVIVPPLRERPREVALLGRLFLDEACDKAGRPPFTLSAATMSRLTSYAWPGNVRELKNVMDYLAATVVDATVEPWHLPAALAAPDEPDGAEAAAAEPAAERPAEPAVPPRRPLADELRDLEIRRMQEALDAAGGVQKRAAELIGMPLRTFAMKAKQHGLTSPRRR